MAEHSFEIALVAGILSPLVSFWILVFFGPRLGKPAAGLVGVVLGMGVPLALATYVLFSWWSADAAARAQLTADAFRYHWADLGGVHATIGVKLDSLTVAMYFMVTFVAFWIFVFSVGYMAGHSDEVDHQSKYHRFFAYLSLFGFSMLGLVVSSSLLFLFIFWELVGLCSYLLIGFYFDRPYASRAAIKAFITNRVGDFGFLIGLMLVYFQLGTLDLDQAATTFAEQAVTGAGIFASTYTLFGWSLATIMGIGLFCGAMGKSAQFPLHVWLPDAMAGPTPVSALIHAATMVAAGVYLVARVFRLMTPDALMFIATIGCLTLFLMALVAIVQTDIKKCLAYSTLSQLGYMIFAMGIGAWIAALFHLITHAFFKAMLFLGSGQVIEGCHHEQDMRKMGGLIKKMPVTGFTFLIGVLAIAGFGIPGTHIGLGGFFSKDEILAVAYARAFEWDDYKKHEVHDDHAAHASVTERSEPGAQATGVQYRDRRRDQGGSVVPEAPQRGAQGEGAGLVERDARVILVADTPKQPPTESDRPAGEFTDDEIKALAERGGKSDYGGVLHLNERFPGLTVDQAVRRLRTLLRRSSDGSAEKQARLDSAIVGFLIQFEKDQGEQIVAQLDENEKARTRKLMVGHSWMRRIHFFTEPDGSLRIETVADTTPSAGHVVPHSEFGKASIFKHTPPLPKWMFALALITAYVTPFYMMRAWWMTFMGKPRDHHVYDHAHESPLMYVPLVVLAVGTFVSSYFLFRPLISEASSVATAAPLVMAIDGAQHTPAITAAHRWLVYGVGFAFVVGFAIAIVIYAPGLAIAERIRRAVWPVHTILEHKYYFDEVYEIVWVKGCVALAKVARFIDTWFVDLIFNLTASATERLAAFSGLILDNQGVDGIVNGISKTSMDVSDVLRGPQTGRIRNYVLFAGAAATIVLIVILYYATQSGEGDAFVSASVFGE